MPDAKDLSPEDTLYWRAAALQDLADVLAVQKLLAEAGEAEPPPRLRLLARLVAEPDGAGLAPVEQLAAAKRRAIGALQVLKAPEPHKADEAAKLAATAWTRIGTPKDMHWALALRPHELFEVSPYQVTLATDPGPFFEPRNLADLDAGQLASVRRCGVWSPIHVRIVEEPAGLLVIAGSRRTRMQRVVIREGLEALASGRDPVRPRPLLALVPAGDIEGDIYLADNLLREGETPWTIAERFALQLEASGGRLRARDIAARTGLSQRLVSYYLVLAGLPVGLRAEGAKGNLGIKFASWLAQVPDLEVQLKLFEVTLSLKSESARMEAARILLEREGPNLADGRELVLPVAQPVRKGAVFAPKIREGLMAAASKAKGAAKTVVTTVIDWCAAWDGDADAAARLPAELRAALPVATPASTQRRRHPSQAKERREETRSEGPREGGMEARPPANGGPKKPGKDKAKRWATYTPDQQAAWEAAGIVDAVDAHSFDRFGIDVATVAQIVQVGEVRGSIGKLFTDRVLTMGQVRERLRQVPIPGTEPADPREVVCPVCGVDEGQDCDDGGHPHTIRADLAAKARLLRPVVLGEAKAVA